jgi:nitric oxide dioxygenase
MSPEQKALVKETWRKIMPMADAAARLFYDRLFELDATTRPLFKTTDLAEQRRKLIQALTTVVQGLDQLEALVPTIADLGRRHAQFGVRHAHYDAVGAALLWTLEQGLGSGWTPEVKVAWSGAYACWPMSCGRPQVTKYPRLLIPTKIASSPEMVFRPRPPRSRSG